MVEGVVSDEVALIGDAARQVGVGLHPPALEEDGGAHQEAPELVEDPGRVLAVVRTIRMLGVEGQSDPEGVGHFSTPVMTMPRMK